MVGTRINTGLVVGMIILQGDAPALTIIPAIPPNSIAELIVAVVIVTAVIAAYHGLNRKQGLEFVSEATEQIKHKQPAN